MGLWQLIQEGMRLLNRKIKVDNFQEDQQPSEYV